MFQQVFSNDHFLMVHKASMVLTIPARVSTDERPVLKKELELVYGPLLTVHRLDCEVEGLILWAKTAEAHRAASQWFEQHLVEKTYWGVGAGNFNGVLETEQSWKSKLMKGKKRTYEAHFGKPSQTLAMVKSASPYFICELKPLTGRTHQLRFECAKHGIPLLGDVLYGQKESSQKGIALMAAELSFAKIPISERFGLPDKLMVDENLKDFVKRWTRSGK